MKLALAGVSHHTASLELRERVAINLEAASALARRLAHGGGNAQEAVVLSTCNRTELYLAADDHERLAQAADDALLALAGADAAALAPLAYRLADESAALHLFRVAAGLDSLVPGEGEILGQVRDAFEAGAPGPLLDRTFRMALHAGRRARVETAIGESPASVPAAAAALAQQVFDDLEGHRVVLVGAGRTSELTARNLRSRGATVAAVVNRSVERAERLASSLGARAVALEEAANALVGADVVVSSTSSPGFVLTLEDLARALRARRGKPVLFVDLAVPRDVDPSLASIDGCFVYDIDDLEAVVSASLDGRRAEAVAAERIVAAEAERFQAWQASLAVVPAIASLRAHAEDVRAAELARVEARLGRLTDAERAMVETVTAQIVNKLLHAPTVRLKDAAMTPDGLIYAEVVRHLFGLDERDEA
ncbi:MAG TPA: glutamyl-tRNA reductase [Gaiella sp.]|nr:glutamyl-tRNA reductase [Gaiella sp.]